MTEQYNNVAFDDPRRALQILPEREATRGERKRAVRTISLVLFALFAYEVIANVTVGLVQYGVLWIFGKDTASELFSNYYFLYGMQIFAMYLVGFPIFALILRKLPKAKRYRANFSFGGMAAAVLILYGTTHLLSIVASNIEALIAELLSDYVRYPAGGSILGTDVPIWLVIAVVVVIGPIVEELVFRKILIDRVSVYGDRLAVAISAITFGLFHGNVTQLIYTTVGGIIFGYVYVKTRKIIYPIILHMVMNFLGSVPSLLLSKDAEEILEILESGDTAKFIEMIPNYLVIFAYSLTTITLMIAGAVLIIALLVKKKIVFSRCCDIRIKKRTVIHACFFTLGAILFYLAVDYSFASSFGLVANYVTEIVNIITKLIGG